MFVCNIALLSKIKLLQTRVAEGAVLLQSLFYERP